MPQTPPSTPELRPMNRRPPQLPALNIDLDSEQIQIESPVITWWAFFTQPNPNVPEEPDYIEDDPENPLLRRNF